MQTKILCKTEEKTILLGELLGKHLKSKDTICLEGELGAGKTAFAKSICASLGINDENVTSPTFSIMNVYEGIETVKHFDLYRIKTLSELSGTGFDEYIEQDGINIIEWSNLFPEALPKERLTINIKIIPEGREFTFTPTGKCYEKISEEVTNAYPGD